MTANTTFDVDEQARLLSLIQTDNDVLTDESFGLSVKSKEAIYQDVEEQLLIPKDRLPAHWLPSYQM